MNYRRWWFSLLACVSLAVFATSARADEEKLVDLSEVRKNPHAYHNMALQIEARFHRFDNMYNPYYTIFTPDRYVNFSAWGISQELWKPKEYAGDAVFLFVDKKGPRVEKFLRLKKYDSFVAKGIVRSTFKGEPWIELMDLELKEETLAEATLVHMVRAQRSQKEGKFDRAIEEYQKAYNEELPELYQGVIMKEIGNCQYYRGDYEEAYENLTQALEWRPNDNDLKERITVTASLIEDIENGVRPPGPPVTPSRNAGGQVAGPKQ